MSDLHTAGYNLHDADHAWLRQEAARRGCSVSALLRRLLAEARGERLEREELAWDPGLLPTPVPEQRYIDCDVRRWAPFAYAAITAYYCLPRGPDSAAKQQTSAALTELRHWHAWEAALVRSLDSLVSEPKP